MSRIRTALLAVMALAVAAPAFAQTEPKTDEDKAFYSFGYNLSQQLQMLNLTPAELAMVQAGLGDGVTKKPAKADPKEFFPKFQTLAKDRVTAGAGDEKKRGAEYLEKAAKEKGATKTASGIVIQEIKAGTGEQPKATDKVKVHYTGALTDGTVFDSSVQRGQPAEFRLNEVIRGWTEGVQMMVEGEKRRLWIPESLAYQGQPGQPQGMLVFDIELLDIK